MAKIELNDVSVSYFLRKTGKQVALERGAVGAQILVGRRYLEIEALRGISFSLCDGDRVGLIGTNGSGKSTLLKLCCGALSPQRGSIAVVGGVCPQFGLGSGLKRSLSGRSNTELKCLYMGVPQSDVGRYVEEVKELSGLAGYFELPIDSYSAGMKSRLVMSLLRLVRGEILIMDEWINAVDPSLNATVGGLQTRLVEKAKILVLASHSKRVLQEWVDKLIWLDHGALRLMGQFDDVYPEYEAWLNSKK